MAAAALELETADDLRAITTANLRLAFRWTGDRWTHQLESGPAADRALLVQAVESDPARDDPARVLSPTYQQFHWQREGESIHAMLLGQSGPHHFSAVFSVREMTGGTEIAIDVADRCRSEAESLACTYRVLLDAGDLISAEPAQIVWNLRGRWALSAETPGHVLLSEGGRSSQLVQAVAWIDPTVQTQRLRYLWKWAPSRAS